MSRSTVSATDVAENLVHLGDVCRRWATRTRPSGSSARPSRRTTPAGRGRSRSRASVRNRLFRGVPAQGSQGRGQGPGPPRGRAEASEGHRAGRPRLRARLPAHRPDACGLPGRGFEATDRGKRHRDLRRGDPDRARAASPDGRRAAPGGGLPLLGESRPKSATLNEAEARSFAGFGALLEQERARIDPPPQPSPRRARLETGPKRSARSTESSSP
jgi:hypothetical protein